MTPFQEQLKEFFPEIYEIDVLGKRDPKLWKALDKMVDMNHRYCYGEIRITYQKGKINHIDKTERE